MVGRSRSQGGVKLSDIEADVIFIVIVTVKWKQDEEHDIIS